MDEVTRSLVIAVDGGTELTVERFWLLVETGPERGRELRLRDQPVVLGRSIEADLVLGDDTVSRRHAVVEPSEAGWCIRDLGSKSGTLLNQASVEIDELRDGDRIRIGKTEIAFRSGTEAIRVPKHTSADFHGLRGESEVMKRLFGLVARVGALDLPVLLTGESGTGKEALARAVHATSSVAEGPYEVVDCTLLGDEHLRSELFGHTKGAYTGASADRDGAFRRASGGTLFLDEVGELPLNLQSTLLRALEEGEVRPLGGGVVTKVRVRVVAATNRDLAAMVGTGQFRADLYYRLAAVVVPIPALRERHGDILLLAEHFLAAGQSLAPETQQVLQTYPWPGNVRQLRNVLVRASQLASRPELKPVDLGPLPDPETMAATLAPSRPVTSTAPGDQKAARAAAERSALEEALTKHQGNREQTADFLGMGRTSLWRRMKKHGLL